MQTMDFDIGNVLYIVVTLVAIIIGLAGKKKKSVPGGTSNQSIFGDLEKAFNAEPDRDEAVMETEMYREDREEEPEAREEVKEVHYQTIDEMMSERGRLGEFEGEYNPEMEQNLNLILEEAERSTGEEGLQVIDLDEEEGNPDYFDIVRDFNPGTAVIYSAIINRTEY